VSAHATSSTGVVLFFADAAAFKHVADEVGALSVVGLLDEIHGVRHRHNAGRVVFEHRFVKGQFPVARVLQVIVHEHGLATALVDVIIQITGGWILGGGCRQGGHGRGHELQHGRHVLWHHDAPVVGVGNGLEAADFVVAHADPAAAGGLGVDEAFQHSAVASVAVIFVVGDEGCVHEQNDLAHELRQGGTGRDGAYVEQTSQLLVQHGCAGIVKGLARCIGVRQVKAHMQKEGVAAIRYSGKGGGGDETQGVVQIKTGVVGGNRFAVGGIGQQGNASGTANL